MPKFYSIKNNNGLAIIPIFIIVLVLSVFGFIGYSYLNNSNLDVLQSTSSTNVTANVESPLSAGGSGTVNINFTTNNSQALDLINHIKSNGVSVYKYCFTQDACKDRKKIIKPVVSQAGLPKGVFYRIRIPVTWDTFSIEIDKKSSDYRLTLNTADNFNANWEFNSREGSMAIFIRKDTRPVSISYKVGIKSKQFETIEFTYKGDNLNLSQVLSINSDWFKAIDGSNLNSNSVKITRPRFSNGLVIVPVQVSTSVNALGFANPSETKNITGTVNGWKLDGNSMLSRTSASTPTTEPSSGTYKVNMSVSDDFMRPQFIFFTLRASNSSAKANSEIYDTFKSEGVKVFNNSGEQTPDSLKNLKCLGLKCKDGVSFEVAHPGADFSRLGKIELPKLDYNISVMMTGPFKLKVDGNTLSQ